jgi:geranylgeranyl pyrophosphate synthase
MRANLPEPTASAWELPKFLGLTNDKQRLTVLIDGWAQRCDPEVRDIVSRQLTGPAKHFRPMTLLACHYSCTNDGLPDLVLRCAAAVELLHNATLVVDDIVDRSRHRRGALSLHCRFGTLRALMVAGYMMSAGVELVADDPYSVRLLAQLTKRLSVAECLQWNVRRRPLGVEDWRAIAAEDTGSMFEICAQLGTRDDRLRLFGRLLGILYHGCDDVADVRGTSALGGGREKDISDGILTLPAAIAIRSPRTAALFRRASPAAHGELVAQLAAALPEADRVLDQIASEAEAEASRSVPDPRRLHRLVRHTRALSIA